MRRNKNLVKPEINTEKNKINKKNLMKSIAYTAVLTVLIAATFVIICNMVTSVKVNKLFSTQKAYIKSLAAADSMQITTIATLDELKTMNDEQLFEAYCSVQDEYKIIDSTQVQSFEELFNRILEDDNSELKYSDFVTFSDYVKVNAKTDITLYTALAFYENYAINLKMMSQLNKAERGISYIYEDNYASVYASLTDLTSIPTALEFTDTILSMITNDEVRTRLLTSNNIIHRCIEAQYSRRVTDYSNYSTNFDSLYVNYFDENATDASELTNLELAACSEFDITGGKCNYYINNSDVEKITKLQTKVSNAILDYTKLLGLDETEEVEADNKITWNDILLKLSRMTPEKIENIRLKFQDYTINLYETELIPLTEDDLAVFDADFVFWNILYGNLDYRLNPQITYIDMTQNMKMFAGIKSGTLTMPDSLAKSLLWITAVQDVYSSVYQYGGFEISDDGNVEVPETNDANIASIRNLYYAWILKASNYVQ